jgi:hypothetical protein
MCKTTSPSGTHKNICSHGAYRDLCVTCHPTDCDIVRLALMDTSSVGIAKVDRRARFDAKRDELDDATERGDRARMSALRHELHDMALLVR